MVLVFARGWGVVVVVVVLQRQTGWISILTEQLPHLTQHVAQVVVLPEGKQPGYLLGTIVRTALRSG